MDLFFGKYAHKKAMAWDNAAKDALAKAPRILRPIIRSKVEKQVLARGGAKVRHNDFQRAEKRYKDFISGKSMDELKKNMPVANKPGVSMVLVLVCHNKLAECKNPLIDTDAWKQAVLSWIKEKDISERLRMRVRADMILMHNKFKISISGCPNGCSRPQIADFGIVGFVRPVLDKEDCTGCGECALVCPDQAITMGPEFPEFNLQKCQGCFSCSNICPVQCIALSKQGAKLIAGGKLGRHPHLAETVGVFEAQDKLIYEMDRIVSQYLEFGLENERLADFLIRGKESEI